MSKKKTVLHSLLNIYGLGSHSSFQILNALGISSFSSLSDLPVFKRDLFFKTLASLRKSSQVSVFNSSPLHFSIEKTVKKHTQYHINRLISNFSYRGARLKMGYPVNGGRTRSNAKTCQKLKIEHISSSL